jgi:hypothetical protein
MKLMRETDDLYCEKCREDGFDPHHGEWDDEASESLGCQHSKPTKKHVIILPGCCEESRKALYPMVWIGFPDNEAGPGDPDQWTAQWYIPLFDRHFALREAWARDEDWDKEPPYFEGGPERYYLQEDPAVTHCPFCGTQLPEIVREPNPPEPFSTRYWDGHCGCGWPRSHGQCGCWPRAALFTTKERT